jgi:hypothetical protein
MTVRAGAHEDIAYQLQQRASTLCELCTMWQPKVRGIAIDHPLGENTWGPSENTLQDTAYAAIVPRVESKANSDDESSQSITDTSGSGDEDDGELLEAMENVVLGEVYHLDSAALDVEDDLVLLSII